ncbi:hypothetical protein A3B45_01335 [Candidatus Daviesbacteria bacterium RIFCSPLOWO2_01_FULL_39_12]|uniref:HicB-like antitoxin of toxin-antitoxin system domain-containing protein n=1 Tax=Candidatus Daviesbacteria bacterium RIFCSPLOWO2_01_FULL_39_12 TaxID=1797785 RepID=A0A1F5KRA4_9BACT|nr:MAG: hypothetical protein A3D79_00515 [Candidatus Daviesbacteria bacterium RIFCSPHIGHO2_02_FULL_39_8]OGE43161.1 MAG: hypothetical protein A3B45_01335 [Candidatus Daviesbacteria bacterium RIFCSPLOWO2_01_FULL_39_12]
MNPENFNGIILFMDIQIPLTIKLTEDKQSKSAPWVAYTPELDVASCGPSPGKAKKNLMEAVEIILKGAADDGNLKDLLLETGFEINASRLTPPKVSLDKFTFNLNPDLTRQIWPA